MKKTPPFAQPKHPSSQAELETRLVPADCRHEVLETFAKAKQVLADLKNQFPDIDCQYLYFLLREQTLLAKRYETPEHRKRLQTWAALCQAVDTFHTTVLGKSTLTAFLQEQETAARKKGEVRKRLKDLWNPDLVWALQQIQKVNALPPVEEIMQNRRGGRPSSWHSDAIVLAMSKHFQEKTKTPRWPTIGKLLGFAPPLLHGSKTHETDQALSMVGENIRQRIVRWKREGDPKRNQCQKRPLLQDAAHQLFRLYQQWATTGKSGHCPSLFDPQLRMLL